MDHFISQRIRVIMKIAVLCILAASLGYCATEDKISELQKLINETEEKTAALVDDFNTSFGEISIPIIKEFLDYFSSYLHKKWKIIDQYESHWQFLGERAFDLDIDIKECVENIELKKNLDKIGMALITCSLSIFNNFSYDISEEVNALLNKIQVIKNNIDDCEKTELQCFVKPSNYASQIAEEYKRLADTASKYLKSLELEVIPRVEKLECDRSPEILDLWQDFENKVDIIGNVTKQCIMEKFDKNQKAHSIY